MTLRLAGSTSGYTEIDAPAVAGSNTLVLPTGNGSSQQVLATNGSGALSWSNRPILQVVSASTATSTSTTSTTYVATSLSASITPATSSNKVLVLIQGGDIDNQATGRQIWCTIYRNSTNVTSGGAAALATAYGESSRILMPISLSYLDSPALTSSITYALYIKSGSGSNVQFNGQGSSAAITLMEVAA